MASTPPGETRIDRFGRVVLPRRARRALGLEPGARLEVLVGEDELRLRLLEPEAKTVLRRGVEVVVAEAGGDLTAAIDAVRAERLASLAGAARRR